MKTLLSSSSSSSSSRFFIVYLIVVVGVASLPEMAEAVIHKMTAFQGQDAILRCPRLTQANMWLNSDKVLTINRDLLGSSDHTKFVALPSAGGPNRNLSSTGFDLKIRSVQFADASVYKCQWTTFIQKLQLVVVSRPKCSSLKSVYKEKDAVTLACDVTTNGDFETEIDWVQVREGVDGGSNLRMTCADNHPLKIPKVNVWSHGQGRKAKPIAAPKAQSGAPTKPFTINSKCTIRGLRSYHHDSQFMCRIRRNDLKPDQMDYAKEEASSCSPGVFNVHFKPQFRCPENQEFDSIDERVEVFCDVIANPFSDEDIKIHWKLNGRPVGARNVTQYEIPFGRRTKVTLGRGRVSDGKIVTLVVFRESRIKEQTIMKEITMRQRQTAAVDWRLVAGICAAAILLLLIFVYCLWRCKQREEDLDSEADEKEKEMEMITSRQDGGNNNRKFQLGTNSLYEGVFPEDEIKWRLHDYDAQFGHPANEKAALNGAVGLNGSTPRGRDGVAGLNGSAPRNRDAVDGRRPAPSILYRVEPLGRDSIHDFRETTPTGAVTTPFQESSGVKCRRPTPPPPPPPNSGAPASINHTRPAPKIPSSLSAFVESASNATQPPRPLPLSLRPSVSPSLCDTPPSAPSSPHSSPVGVAVIVEGSDVELVPSASPGPQQQQQQPRQLQPRQQQPHLKQQQQRSSQQQQQPHHGAKSKFSRSHSYTKSMGRADVAL